MNDLPDIFDRALHRQNRRRAVARFAEHDFLFREIGTRLVERLQDVNRQFERALILGGRAGLPKDIAGETVVLDLAEGFSAGGVVGDEEALPFRDASFDLVMAPLGLHWTNDLPGALIQLRRALRPDGLLLAALFGAGTLDELRQSLMTAEQAIEGGVSPRVSPFAEIRDAGGLLQRAGFALPVADAETITVTYEHPLKLLGDLRGMGEQNALTQRRRTFLHRETLIRAMAQYSEQYALADGRIPATFNVLFLAGWAPHESQQKPLRPGAAQKRLADALGVSEQGAGEATDGAPPSRRN